MSLLGLIRQQHHLSLGISGSYSKRHQTEVGMLFSFWDFP